MMRNLNKYQILPIVIILMASSLIMVKTSSAADSTPKPFVPEFTVRFVNASYPVTETNPYTGINETKLASNDSIEVIIKNQPLDASNGYVICFNVRAKPHFEGNWT
jgi:hypothetical protein